MVGKESERKMRKELLDLVDEWAEIGRQLMNILRRDDQYHCFDLTKDELLELIEAAVMTRGMTGSMIETGIKILKTRTRKGQEKSYSIDLICSFFRLTLRIKREARLLQKSLLKITSKGVKKEEVEKSMERLKGFRFFYPRIKKLIDKAPWEI
jgi:hypothetical protein